DMNCKVVSEEPDEDPEKPPIQVFERLRRQRPAGGRRDNRQNDEGGRQKSRPAGRKGASKAGRPNRGKQDRQQSFSAKSREPDPQSPFAVLADLKLKS
ncbi:MAG: disulfide oxidoreductase, partial [Candidatus Puniceispirillaceae bacterium]